MIVMPSNNTGFECGYLAGMFPGRIGHLHSCDQLTEPRLRVTWALDNGVFGAWQSGREWSEEPLFRFLDAYAAWNPEWVVCPDWVADRDLTLARWRDYSPALRAFGVALAFVVQDGMTAPDVPNDADIVFVGGSTAWKWRTVREWCAAFPRVHVGRVNTYNLLWQAHDAGAESCDGTGWFRGGAKRLAGLVRYLQESSNGVRPQMTMEAIL